MGNANSGANKLTPEDRKKILRLRASGMRVPDVAAQVGRSESFTYLVIQQAGGVVTRAEWNPSPHRLSIEDREAIMVGLHGGESCRAIAARLARHPSTISREVKANGGREGYAAWRAHRQAARQARRPKEAKLASCPQLREEVEAGLKKAWSPVQISQRLRHDHPDDPMMRVSPETIYQSLYVQGRGALRKELASCLRTGRAIRRPRGRTSGTGSRIPDKVMISERPAEVEDRAVPGHWEGDLIVGASSRSAVGTLVERTTRFLMLLHLPDGHGAEAVRQAMTAKIATLSAALARSVTWDQGSEMAQHARFTVETGIPVYFCDPRSPWQRGTNENTNGLLRQFLPKSTDLSKFTEADLDHIADLLNGRPRQTLNWLTPSEALDRLVASTG